MYSGKAYLDLELHKEIREYQQQIVGQAVDEWLSWGDVEPRFTWPKSGPEISFTAGGTFGIIGAQIMLLVSKSQYLAICSGCGDAYLRRGNAQQPAGRKPQRGRRNFCPVCQNTGIAARLRKRDERAATQKDEKNG